MFKLTQFTKLLLCLFCIIFSLQYGNAQSKKNKKQKDEPFMHISFESPLWLSNPNTLDNTHKAGFGFRANFPLQQTPWNFIIGFTQYNYGEHLNLLDISDSGTIAGNEGSITFREGTYVLKYAGLPLGLKYDKKFWSASFELQMLFNLNQAEVHSPGFTLDFGIEEFEDFDKDKVNKLNSALTFSFAGQLPLGDRWSLYAEPELQFLVKPVFKNGIDDVGRANIFLKIGLRHLIKLPTDEIEARK